MESVPRDQALPLSYAQQGLWLTAQASEHPPFNHPIAVRIHGPLDPSALGQSVNELIRRHETLHTNCELRDGNPVLAIRAPREIRDFHVDLRSGAEDQRDTTARRLAEEDIGRPFDLSQDPLMRAKLLQTGPSEFILLLTLHTFAADGYSHGLLLRELSRIYQSIAKGAPHTIPASSLQFADYASWQRRMVQGRHLASLLSFWKEQLQDCPSTLQWPIGASCIKAGADSGGTHRFSLSTALSEGIRDLARREGITVFALLFASLSLLLNRVTGQRDILVGTTVSNRAASELEGLVGYFANTLLLRAQISEDLPFREFARQCQSTAARALANQDFPFEKLVQELAVDPAFSHVPRLQVVFVLHDHVAEEDLELPGMRIEPFPVERGAASFELYLRIADTEGPMSASVEYSTELFDNDTVSRLTRQLEALLAAVTIGPDAPIGSLAAGNRQELDDLVQSWREVRKATESRPISPTTRQLDARWSQPTGPAESALRRLVTDVWKEVLETDDPGPNANFFELGGRSVHVIQVHSKLEARLHRDIPVVDLFHYPTLDALCKHLQGNKDDVLSTPPTHDRGALLRASRSRRLRAREHQPQPSTDA